MTIETVGGTSVSSDSRGEDGCHELAGAVHFHVASPAQILSILPRVPLCLAAFFVFSLMLVGWTANSFQSKFRVVNQHTTLRSGGDHSRNPAPGRHRLSGKNPDDAC